MNVNATPVRVTLVQVSGNSDQRTRIRAGTRTRVCVYAPLDKLQCSLEKHDRLLSNNLSYNSLIAM